MSELVPARWRDSLERLHNELSSTLNRWFGREARHAEDSVPWTATVFTTGPSVDLIEDERDILVTAELPGLKESDLRVELHGNRLIIRGEKKTSREEKGGGRYYSESRYGSFCRAVPLPCEADWEKSKATYKNGLLEVRLPKTESARARRIHVKVS